MNLKNILRLFTVFILVFAYSIRSTGQPAIQIFTPSPTQGSLIIGRILVQGELYFRGEALLLTDTGEFVFGIGRDSKAHIELEIRQGNEKILYPISIRPRLWKVEKINGLPASKVNPKNKETLSRIKREGKKVAIARTNLSIQQAFMMQFIAPAKGRISGVYGSQRVLNGEAKRPHFGLDIANKKGTPVIAPADGIVVLAENDLYFSGGTIIIDHGYSVFSTYLHLSRLDVQVGQEIKQTEKIGEIGATGRATGPHLDWRLNWKSVRLDPQLLLEKHNEQD
ncbi:MAG: M23 family metallopeptidase [Enterobacterales bacterium]|nr:M23 family metallopeptidase [Enterobacterales bacterium]